MEENFRTWEVKRVADLPDEVKAFLLAECYALGTFAPPEELRLVWQQKLEVKLCQINEFLRKQRKTHKYNARRGVREANASNAALGGGGDGAASGSAQRSKPTASNPTVEDADANIAQENVEPPNKLYWLLDTVKNAMPSFMKWVFG